MSFVCCWIVDCRCTHSLETGQDFVNTNRMEYYYTKKSNENKDWQYCMSFCNPYFLNERRSLYVYLDSTELTKQSKQTKCKFSNKYYNHVLHIFDTHWCQVIAFMAFLACEIKLSGRESNSGLITCTHRNHLGSLVIGNTM